MDKLFIIQNYINKFKYTSYLELGVLEKWCFREIQCNEKTGVDPAVPVNSYWPSEKGFQLTSDDFFASLDKKTKYDLIFIDGLHTEEQVDKDIENSLKHLNENGTIVLHDCNPESSRFEEPDRCGTVWRSIYKFRKSQTKYDLFVVDVDHGCGVIRKTPNTFTPFLEQEPETLDYNFLNAYRKDVLNLKSSDEFIKILQE